MNSMAHKPKDSFNREKKNYLIKLKFIYFINGLK